MSRSLRFVLPLVLAIVSSPALVACKNKVAAIPAEGADVTGEAARPNRFLAYEHAVDIELAAEAVASRADAVRSACHEQRWGACSLLSIDESSGQRSRVQLVLRVAPEAVEPLVALAAEGGRRGNRTLKADDLADAVADTTRQRETLLAQRERLREFSARKDLSATDLIALSTASAETEVGLQAAERTAADQQRRIETNRLTLDLSSPWASEGRGARMATALGDSGDAFVDGVEEMLALLAYGLPFLLVAFPLALGWRWAWRRVVRGRPA